MVTKYCQYEVLNFADKLHIQYIPFKLLSVSDTAEYKNTQIKSCRTAVQKSNLVKHHIFYCYQVTYYVR